MNDTIEARDPLLGTRIDGRYLVKGVLGRGGMGVVYDAVHEQLGRPVAIKVLGSGIAGDPVAVERFLREARVASTLTHGNIVDVSDLGQLPDGRPYLVMAKMTGKDLCTLMQEQGPQTPARVVELLEGAAAGLDLIHAKGFVHRDIKPENLMHVVREDGSEAVLLLDFGIAAFADAAQSKRLTAEGKLFGTPAYLPPEVLDGSLPDRRGDVYALATVAYELMAGRPPYDDEHPMRTLTQKMTQDAPPMSAVCTRRFPSEIEAVIARGLARKPDDRYKSAGEFVAALEAAVRASSQSEASATTRSSAFDTSTLELESAIGHTGEHGAASPVRTGRTETALTSETVVRAPRKKRAPLMLFALGSTLAALVVWGLTSKSAPESLPTEPTLPHAHTAAAAARVEPSVITPSLAPTAPEPSPEPEPPAAPAPSEPSAETQAAPPSASLSKRKADAPKLPAAPANAASAAPTLKVSAAPVQPAPEPPETNSGASELVKQATQVLLQGQLSQAAELYARATRLDPKSEAAWRGLGIANERLGRSDEAIRAFKKALALAPSGPHSANIRTRLAALEGP